MTAVDFNGNFYEEVVYGCTWWMLQMMLCSVQNKR